MKQNLLASVAMEETETTYARKIFQWKFWKQKKELTHFLGHYWVYAIILVIILFYFTSSNISYADYQRFIFLWYKNVSSI